MEMCCLKLYLFANNRHAITIANRHIQANSVHRTEPIKIKNYGM